MTGDRTAVTGRDDSSAVTGCDDSSAVTGRDDSSAVTGCDDYSGGRAGSKPGGAAGEAPGGAAGEAPGSAAGTGRWLALVFISIAQLMVALDATIINIALPSAQHALHISDAERQWVITAYTLAFGGLLLLGGRLADGFGRKRTFAVGLAGFAVASAAGGAAPGFGALLAARAAQGAFAALLAPTVLSLLALTFTEPRERAKAFAVFGAIAGTGGAAGLLLGGILTEYVQWRWCLLVNVPVAVAALVGGCLLLPNVPAHKPSRLDAPGALLVTAGLVAQHYSPARAGVAFLPMSAAVFFSSTVVARKLLPRVPPRLLAVPGLLVAAAGMATLTQLHVHSSYLTHVLPAVLLVGFGIGCVFVPVISTATSGVGPRDAGVASATANTAQQVGASVGTALLNTIAASVTATYLASRAHSHATAAAGLVHGYATASAWTAGILVAAAAVAGLLINVGKPSRAG